MKYRSENIIIDQKTQNSRAVQRQRVQGMEMYQPKQRIPGVQYILSE